MHERANLLAFGGADHCVGLRDVEHDDRDVALLGELCGHGVHYTQLFLEKVPVPYVVVLLRSGNELRIGVVDPIDSVLAHKHDVSIDLRSTKRSRCVSREEGVPGPGGKDDDMALLEVMDCTPAD